MWTSPQCVDITIHRIDIYAMVLVGLVVRCISALLLDENVGSDAGATPNSLISHMSTLGFMSAPMLHSENALTRYADIERAII